MWGEEGAIGTPPRLQLIKEEIEKNGNLTGWDGDAYLAQYEAFDTFLKTHPDFQKAFPDVDAFTRSFGNVAMYYQGRIIENIRIGNVVDCYAVNGWEETKIEIIPVLWMLIVIRKGMLIFWRIIINLCMWLSN